MTAHHILITTDAVDSAGLLAPAPCGGRVPCVTMCGPVREAEHYWRTADQYDAPELPRALPLLFDGTPTGPLAVARALEVLAAAEGRTPVGLGLHLRTVQPEPGAPVEVNVTGLDLPLHFTSAGWGRPVSGLDRPAGDLGDALGLWALATVVAAHVPGCGVEVVHA